MTREEAKEAIKEAYGNSEYTDEIIKALEQEPCEMTAEEYRERMIQAFHNSDCDELIAVCVQPTEKEFEHLEWLLKNHYKKEPCEDAISRKALYKALYEEFHDEDAPNNITKVNLGEVRNFVKDFPSITPQEHCNDVVSRQSVLDMTGVSDWFESSNDYNDFVEKLCKLPPVTPTRKKGKWIIKDREYNKIWLCQCSQCEKDPQDYVL